MTENIKTLGEGKKVLESQNFERFCKREKIPNFKMRVFFFCVFGVVFVVFLCEFSVGVLTSEDVLIEFRTFE